MSESLRAATTIYAFVLAGWCGVRMALGRPLERTQLAAAAVVEAALVLNLALSVVQFISRGLPPDPGKALGYLAASVLILPVIMQILGPRRGAVDNGVVALGLVAVAIVCLRMEVVL